MSYLENAIRDKLKDAGYICTIPVKDIAKQIEEKNNEPNKFYNVSTWLRDIKIENPKVLIRVDEVLSDTVSYLQEQKEQCFKETGCAPTIEDYEVYFTCDEFADKVPYVLTIEEYIDYLTEYYAEKELYI